MADSGRFTLPAVPAVLLSIVSVQGGAAIAKGLFPLVGAAGTASLRIGLSALVLMLVVRPKLGQLSSAQWRAVVPYGLALGLMNFLFYCSLARIPLGLAVTLEFVGPLGLALAGSRRWGDAVWALLAAAGIGLIAPWHGQGIDLLGLAFALAAGACWVVYIVLGQRTAAVLPGQQAVAIGMLFAALPVLPFGVASGSLLGLTPHLLLLGGLLALFSSVLPFSLEMQALRSLPTRTFSILMSLEPVAAAISGWLLLGERLLFGQWLAVGFIVIASVGATLTARDAAPAVGGE
ncbi:EamA family transporter [Hymenobacter negativus]|uniref:EamA family transporter n=1 Tax=Hymenobacter negativus TaxID=2795026 RepID=A0ABS0QC47_9BACT|nr:MULTISPECIES: EamA family transporter [Bacteria]MBH8560140.1 EamA family transporter [Hymenobacter negativus]MBH8568165.1 EamA family transporter [Hymenobacter negativus]MBR7207900.1 EamA family transporter [Microvirga sp. STS02]